MASPKKVGIGEIPFSAGRVGAATTSIAVPSTTLGASNMKIMKRELLEPRPTENYISPLPVYLGCLFPHSTYSNGKVRGGAVPPKKMGVRKLFYP